MSELIDRQAAIKAVCERECREITPCKGECGSIWALESLPTIQPEPQWIPVSERLPEESGTYTVTAHDGVTTRVTYAKYQKRLKRWELTGARAYWKVLAWMPLPEAYKPNNE